MRTKVLAVARAALKRFAEDVGDGKWITVNGRHIFIKRGESVKDALAASATRKVPQIGAWPDYGDYDIGGKRYSPIGARFGEQAARAGKSREVLIADLKVKGVVESNPRHHNGYWSALVAHKGEQARLSKGVAEIASGANIDVPGKGALRGAAAARAQKGVG